MVPEYKEAVVQQDAIVVDVGSDEQPVYIPSNLLTILPGNGYRHALIDKQQSTMITTACRPAISNKSLILRSGLPLLGIHGSVVPSEPVRAFAG